MKRVFTFLFLLISISTFAQKTILDERISIYFFENNFVEIFQKIEDYSNAEFAYSEDFLPDTSLTINFSDKKISWILDRLFQKTNLIYKSQENRIIISYDDNKYSKSQKLGQKHTLNGYLSDSKSGEELIGGTIRIIDLNQGCFTNTYGFFSITLPKGFYEVEATYIGYKSTTFEINLSKNQQLKIELEPYGTELEEITVVGTKSEQGISFGETGGNRIDLKDINSLPGLLSEKDLFGTLQLLPGIQATGEGNGGFSIRGGSSDQNLILLDEAPIYNPAHLLGIFSIFNPDAIRDVRVMKSHIPTKFRGRLSSVVDIHMKEGNIKEFKASGGIGLMLSRLSIEGPFAKGKGSYMIAGRRTYHDLWLRQISSDNFRIYFYDLNAKANYKLNDNNRFFFSIYSGSDVLTNRNRRTIDSVQIENNFRINWGNITTTMRWNHLFNDKLFSNTTLIYSDFDFDSSTNLSGLIDIDNLADSSDFLMRTRIRNYHLKQTFNYYPDPNNSFQFGLNFVHHTFIPGKILDEELQPTGGETSNRFALESSLFVSHNLNISDKWNLDYGIHFSNFTVLGGDDYIYNYDNEGSRIDSTFYSGWETIKNYFGAEPRISLTHQFDDKKRLNLTYFHTIQYLQFLPSAFINNPASTWFPSSHLIKPQRAHQISLGYHYEFEKERWESSLEVFGKRTNRQIAYREGATLELGSDIESQLVFGKAWSYGAEFLLKKRVGKLRGWTSLTYSRAKNQFEDLNNGEAFNSEFDRPVSLSFVGILEPNPKFTITTTWSFASGKIVTVPAGKFQIGDQIIDFYNRRNNFRMSNFHRLDVALRWKSKTKRGGNKYWSLALYNLYARKNASFVYLQENDILDVAIDDNSKVWEVSLLPFVVPSFSFYFEL